MQEERLHFYFVLHRFSYIYGRVILICAASLIFTVVCVHYQGTHRPVVFSENRKACEAITCRRSEGTERTELIFIEMYMRS